MAKSEEQPSRALESRFPRALRPAFHVAVQVCAWATVYPLLLAPIVAWHPELDLSAAIAVVYRVTWRWALEGGYPAILSMVVYGYIRALDTPRPLPLRAVIAGVASSLTFLASATMIIDFRLGRDSADLLSATGLVGVVGVVAMFIVAGTALAWLDMKESVGKPNYVLERPNES